MKIYIAGFFDTRARLYPMRDALEADGHEVTSRWLQESEEATYADVTEGYRLACALQDMADVKSSELMILDTLDITPRGGREFEMGIAVASGIPVAVVGPFRTVFHRLARWHFDDWESVLRWIHHVRRI